MCGSMCLFVCVLCFFMRCVHGNTVPGDVKSRLDKMLREVRGVRERTTAAKQREAVGMYDI